MKPWGARPLLQARPHLHTGPPQIEEGQAGLVGRNVCTSAQDPPAETGGADAQRWRRGGEAGCSRRRPPARGAP